MALNFDDLTAQVAANASVEDSAIQLISTLAAEIAALPANQAAIDDLAAKVKAKAADLAAAVAAVPTT